MAMAAGVNLASDQLLFRAALALHEHREVRVRDARQPRAQLLHQHTLTHEHRPAPKRERHLQL